MTVLFTRALQARIPSSAPLIITAVDPGLCHSEILRFVDKGPFADMLTKARSTEEGSRQLVYATVGPDITKLNSAEAMREMRGAYVADAEASDPSPWVLSEDGSKLQEKIWASLNRHDVLSLTKI